MPDNNNLEGLADLMRQLERLETSTKKKALRNAMNQAMLPVVHQARAAVPVGTQAHRTNKGNLVSTGFLKRSIKRKSWISRDGKVNAVVGVKKEAFYGVQFLELGTKFITANPWLQNAFESVKHLVERKLVESLKKQIEKAIARGRG